MNCELEDKVLSVKGRELDELAVDVFRHQFSHNPLYRSFVETLGVDPGQVTDLLSIPFLPVAFFKYHDVKTGSFDPGQVFESSGTTRSGNSRHLVRSLALYEKSFLQGFELFYGLPEDWCIVGLLPSYLERGNSSLVRMVDGLIRRSGHPDSGFYLDEFAALAALLKKNEAAAQKTLLIGVTFALLDLSKEFPFPLQHTVVMETGGMKGRRRELTREEVHAILKQAWHQEQIHSEYGMTELLSQAYSKGEGVFRCPPWMKVLLRDEDDPLGLHGPAQSGPRNGLVNVVDLANLHSCSFIATDDIGRLHPDGSFEITGRMDSSDVRGCSLLYT